MPTKAVQHVLRRLQKRRILAPENGTFKVTSDLPASNLGQLRQQAKIHIDSVINALITTAAEHGRVWTTDDATNAATAFLSKFTVECLRTFIFRTALPVLPATTSSDLYVVSKFLTAAQERGDAAFDSFIVLVKGLMYSNALLCPDLESLEKKFQDVTFYLDTPIILNLLGLQGAEAKRSADELIALIIKLKGSLAVFSHTVVESQHVLTFAATNLENPRVSGKVIEEARRSRVKLSDLILARDSMDDRLRRMQVFVRKSPDYTSDYQIDERAFESVLAEEVYYKGDGALLNDINSVRSIYILRKGRQPVRLEDSGAVFVTTNHGFARAAYTAGRHHNSTREVSSVITAYSLANIAWLKSPLEAPTLPARETMALCYAALEPSRDLFHKYVEEMDRLLASGQISTRDHEILRLSPSAKDELMELTLGEEDALTHSSIWSILANAKKSIISEQQVLHDAELKAIAEKGAEKLSEAQIREQALIEQLQSVQNAVNSEAERAAQLARAAQETAARQLHRAQRFARKVTWWFIVPMLSVLFAGALIGAGLISAGSHASATLKYALSGLVVITVLWGLYSWYNGKTLLQIADSLERMVTNRAYRWLHADSEPS